MDPAAQHTQHHDARCVRGLKTNPCRGPPLGPKVALARARSPHGARRAAPRPPTSDMDMERRGLLYTRSPRAPLSLRLARSDSRSPPPLTVHGGLTKVTLRSRSHATVCRAHRHATHAHRPHASVTTYSFHWCGGVIGVAHAARNALRLRRVCCVRRVLLAAAAG